MQYIFLILFYTNTYIFFKITGLTLNSNIKYEIPKHIASAVNVLLVYILINTTAFASWHLYIMLLVLFVIETVVMFDGASVTKSILGSFFPFNFIAINMLVLKLCGMPGVAIFITISIVTFLNVFALFRIHGKSEIVAQIFHQKQELIILYAIIHFCTLLCLIISSIMFEATIITMVFLICCVIIIYSGLALLTTFNIVNGQRFILEQQLETMEMYKKLLIGRSLTVIEVDLNEDIINFYMHDKLALIENVGIPYSQFIDDNIISKVYSADKIRVRERISIDYIMKVYDNGIDAYEVEYRVCDANNNYSWVKCIIHTHHQLIDDRCAAVMNIIDINSEKEREHNLLSQAQRDTFTGLYNKPTTIKLISHYLKNHGQGILFIIDLDNFKNVNDQISHSMGDIAIKESANKIRSAFRENDIVGRFGGDEFIVFAKTTPEDLDLFAKCRRINKLIDTAYRGENIEVRISASIGVAIASEDVNCYEELFELADQAVYTSKKNGKNTFTVAKKD
ncbi:MAG: hypothetical protein ATN34_03915 [Epulopiscium sp. Nele67-Bin002]|nr:MAG: hypothetical protein ATN34_03915 [Epulopiscium sp. Nele67-Bin002]OON93599.1 MAG: hypothetical protein ATN33_05565 [Epulopiscium sp. Nele67-Bin001]